MGMNMTISVRDISAAIGASAEGDLDFVVTGLAEPSIATENQLALAMNPSYAEKLASGNAKAAVVWPDCNWRALGLVAAIFVPRARLAMAGLTQAFDPSPEYTGIHSSALIDANAVLSENVSVGPFTSVGSEAVIGEGCRIGANVTIGTGARIGAGTVLCDGVRVGRNVVIGTNALVQFNAVIGSDGFSFVTEEQSNVERARKEMHSEAVVANPATSVWHRIHSLGGVEIGNDVEVGAGTTIDAGTIRPTKIGRGTKIDNLVHVGHNVIVGEDCLLCGQVGIAGSSVIGDRTVLGGQAGIGDNLNIGSDVVITGATKVMSNVPSGRVMMGSPAVKIETHVETYKALRRLPKALRVLSHLQKSVSKPDN